MRLNTEKVPEILVFARVSGFYYFSEGRLWGLNFSKRCVAYAVGALIAIRRPNNTAGRGGSAESFACNHVHN